MRRIMPFVLALVPLFVSAKSYDYPLISTSVRLQADGSARIVQERTYSFDGSFSWAFVDLKKQGAQDVVLNRLAEKTDGGWHDIKPRELNNSAKSLYIEWGYSAQDEEKTFLLDYTVVGAVKRYEDVAEFYWKVVEDEHEPAAAVAIDVVPPGPSPNLFKVYVHSAARPGRLGFSQALDRATITQSQIPRNAFVEVRVLTDPGLYPQTAQIARKGYQRILDEEKRNFAVSSFRKYVFIPLGLGLLLLVPLALLFIFYFRFGREPKLDYEAIYEHEPPRSAPPVAVPFILHQKPDKSAMTQELFQGMMATLLDLGRRGAVSVVETKHWYGSRYTFRLEKPEVVTQGNAFDRSVTEFFFSGVAGGGSELTDEMLKDYGRSHNQEVRAFLSGLYSAGTDWWRNELGMDFTDRLSARAYRLYCLLIIACAVPGALLVVNGIKAIAPEMGGAQLPITAVAGLGVFFLFAVLGRVIYRWNPTALLEHKRWQNFRKFLRDFSAIEQAPVSLLAIWEQYYVYAVVLGVAAEFLKNVTRLAEQRGAGLALPVWYVAASGSGEGVASLAGSLAGFQSFADNVNGMMQSFSTASSSGGGFSGGGGGGGGGGSSGAG